MLRCQESVKYFLCSFKVYFSMLYSTHGVKRMNKYEINTEKKKREIISAALSLFAEKGFTKVSIKEIAKLAHVSQVSIYNYFGSKKALITECANIVMDDTLRKARDILIKEMGFAEKIESALLLCTENINLSVSEYFSTEALNDPALVNLLVKNLNESKKNIYLEYVELGKQENAIDSTIPTELFLRFMDAINSMGSTLELDDDISATVKHIHHLFLYGIIGKA